MIFKHKRILLVSPEPWDHIFVSKHHYAIHLSKRENLVYYLNPPSDGWKIEQTDYKNVWQVSYTGFLKGLRFLPSFVRRFETRSVLKKLEGLCRVQFDVVWSFDNSVFFDFSALPERIVKISHTVDLNQNFQLGMAARTADYCFCTTDLILERLRKYNKDAFKINHGFSGAPVRKSSITLPGNSNVKALYAGNLAMPYIDWCLIEILVKQNPQVDFVFVGPSKDKFNQDVMQNQSKKEVLGCSNCFFTGKIDSEDLLSFESQADILLVAYQEKYHDDQSNPHKMMEYLGSGKMIVSTFTKEYDGLHQESLFLMSRKNSELPQLFLDALNNLTWWNSNEKRCLRQQYAEDNSYDRQINRIERLIKKSEYRPFY